MSRQFNLALAALATVGLAACATTTPYQPLKDGQGYAEQKIESNRYKVTFSGNSSTSKQTVENYLLFRAAEVTLANGYDYFVVADRDTESDTRYSQSYNGFGGFGYGWYPRSSVGFGASTAIPSTEYEAQASILVFKGKKPETETKAYDAREVKQNLETLVLRPQKT